jgi:hypothetical protein
MTSPFRDFAVMAPILCPRCKKVTLPPLDVAACSGGCGTLVSSFAATEIFSSDELRVDALTQWWRRKEKCVLCDAKMELRGRDPGLFQGCDGHAFWIDQDAIVHTSLATGVDLNKLEVKRNNTAIVEREREWRLRAEQERDAERRAKEQAEQRVVVRMLPLSNRVPSTASVPPTFYASDATFFSDLAAKVDMLESHNRILESRVTQLEADMLILLQRHAPR